jgi:GH15 family glucan-1,4-alpha-glucosidase
MHPLTGAPLSVAPLTWSHAVFVDTVLQFAEKEKELARKKEI